MARSFNRSLDHRFKMSEAPVTVPPFSMACWAYSTWPSGWTYQGLMEVVNGSIPADNFHQIIFFQTGSNRYLRCWTRSSAGNAIAEKSGVPLNTWFHACGVWPTYVGSRHIYLDGVKASNYTIREPTGIDTTTIATRLADESIRCWDGYMAEVGIWEGELSDDEVKILAAGYSPLFVKPQKLVAYWPFIRQAIIDFDPPPDRISGYQLTPYGPPGTAVHPRIIHPAGLLIPKILTQISRPLVGGSLAAGRKGLVA